MIGLLTILGSIACLGGFFYGKQKLHPGFALIGTWLLAISISQLNFSPLQESFTQRYWLLITAAAAGFLLGWFLYWYYRKKQLETSINTGLLHNPSLRQRIIFWSLIGVLFAIVVIANIHIYAIFDTLPLFHKDPERLRFTINKVVFGPWEYLAIAPRIIIPLIAAYWFTISEKRVWEKFLFTLSLVSGFAILLLYTSRATVVFALLLSYAIYLISRAKSLSLKKIVTSSLAAFLLIAIFSIAIPATRHYISFKQTYADEHMTSSFQPFAYYYELAQLTLPTSVSFLASPYLSLSFNQQSLNAATKYYPDREEYYYGRLHLSTFSIAQKFLNVTWQKVQVPWVDIFLPWWNTGTFLFSYYADGGLLVTFLALIGWGFVLSLIHNRAIHRPTVITIILYGYAIFVAVMSMYTNFILRPEFYLDLIFIFGIGGLVYTASYGQPQKNSTTQ